MLFAVTGYPFCNTSKFTMKKLKAEVEQIPFTYPGGIEKSAEGLLNEILER